MTGSKHATDQDWKDPDEVPDLATDEWAEVVEATPVRRGRPKSRTPKELTTLRLDPDILEYYRASGPGWQTRINAALRKAAGL